MRDKVEASKGLSLLETRKKKRAGGGKCLWPGKSMCKTNAEEASHSETKPAIHVSQKTWWKFLARTYNVHRDYDLKITQNAALPVSKPPPAEGTAWLRRERKTPGGHRRPPRTELEFPRTGGGFWEKVRYMSEQVMWWLAPRARAFEGKAEGDRPWIFVNHGLESRILELFGIFFLSTFSLLILSSQKEIHFYFLNISSSLTRLALNVTRKAQDRNRTGFSWKE